MKTELLIHGLRTIASIENASGSPNVADVLFQSADRLESLDRAIRETLEEHRHLADGEDCTLRRLKIAIGEK